MLTLDVDVPRGKAKLSGSFIVSDAFPLNAGEDAPVLVLRGEEGTLPVVFNDKRTPKLARRFTDGGNADRARIVSQFIDLHRFPLHLFLETPDGRRSDYIRSFDLPELRDARMVALMEIYARSEPEARSNTLFKTLYKRIDGRPTTLRNRIARRWLYGLFDRRPARGRMHMTHIRKAFETQGRPLAFDALTEHMTSHGVAIAPHGGMTFDGLESATVWEAFDVMAERLAELGLTVFLNSGTLLGVVRDGDFLPHDDDIDVAVLLDARNEEEAAEAFSQLRTLLEEEELIDPEANVSAGIHKLKRVGPVQVDLFPAWISEEGRLFVYPYSYGDVPREALMDLVPWQGNPRRLIPKDPDTVLSANYGEGWRVPDPFFVFPWTKAKKRFSAFLSLLEKELK
ncbi:LicD family protein [Thioclava sp. 'Guangxiensis']|uniref:LicD family protein n=1 Tax=Thioclava sp. 'Guangxiensis' TaxID=3149044 RepID=UPI00387814AE